MCCVGDNEGEKWTPRVMAQSVRSMSGSRGGVIFWAKEGGENYFLNFECVNFKFILVGPLKDVRKFCFQSGGGVLGTSKVVSSAYLRIVLKDE